VRITIADGKDAPDWKMFRLVAHRIIMGVAPNAFSAEPVDELLAALREIKRHIQQVNEFLRSFPTRRCRKAKVTRELSRKYPELRVVAAGARGNSRITSRLPTRTPTRRLLRYWRSFRPWALRPA